MAVPCSVEDMLKYVQNCNYPTNQEGVINCAKQNGAPHEVLQGLHEMYPNAVYSNVGQVKEEIQRHRAHISH